MIQRLASTHTVLLALLSSLVLAGGPGCAARRNLTVPRTLDGVSTRSPFVPPSSYEALVRGELLLAEGRPAEAAHQLELATAAPEEDAYLLSRLATALLAAGDREAAAETLENAARVDPCSEEVWLTRGALAESAGDTRAARAAYARAADCAPRSPRGQLALARVLRAEGDDAGALTMLMRAAERPYGDRLEPQLGRALADAEPAALAHALASLGSHRAPDPTTFADALAMALQRGLPRVALRAHEQHATRIPRKLEAEILLANDRREALATLVARSSADELGGAAETARFALAAGAYERAELETTGALLRGGSDALHALRAEALLGLGNPAAALEDVRAIREEGLRLSVVGAILGRTGAPWLAAEVAARDGARTQTTNVDVHVAPERGR